MSSTYWRDTRNPAYKLASEGDFLEDENIPERIRKSFQDYIRKTDPKTLKKNEKGYYILDWVEDDETWKRRYDATYHDRFGWGVRRGPMPEKPKEVQVPTPGTGTSAAFSPEAIKILEKIYDVLENIAKSSENTKQYMEILTELVSPESFKKVSQLKQEQEQAAQQ